MIRLVVVALLSALLASCAALDCAGEAERGGYLAGCNAEIRY